jgi:hypothetical protein
MLYKECVRELGHVDRCKAALRVEESVAVSAVDHLIVPHHVPVVIDAQDVGVLSTEKIDRRECPTGTQEPVYMAAVETV